MHNTKEVIAVLLLFMATVLSGCQSLQDVAESKEFSVPKGVTLLTEPEIREALIGNSYSGDSVKFPGNQYLEFIQPDGSINGLWNGRSRYDGEWAVHGKIWCYKRRNNSDCNTVSRSGSTIYWHHLDGRSDRARSRLYQGNPKNL